MLHGLSDRTHRLHRDRLQRSRQPPDAVARAGGNHSARGAPRRPECDRDVRQPSRQEGNRRGKSDGEAIDNCVAGLNAIKARAEEQRVTICLELLNSKIDHPDYQGDRTAFGVAVVKAVGSPRVRLLYDIYHMQIMEGDIIRTIRDNREWIAHFHTGGVPGRHELDGTQELNWHAVAAAIADTGFAGFVAHEFTPTRDPLTSLREAVAVCTV